MKRETIAIRIQPEILKIIEEKAEKEERTKSRIAERLIIKALEAE